MKVVIRIRYRKAAPALTWGESPLATTLFLHATRPRRRVPSFAGSTLLHGLAIAAMSQVSYYAPIPAPRTLAQNYSIRFVHLQSPVEYWAGSTAKEAPSPAAKASPDPSGNRRKRPANARIVPGPETDAPASAAALAGDRGRFHLPPMTQVQPVKQTLVETDLPPDIVLKHEIPLPTVMLWAAELPPPKARRDFVAPPVKQSQVTAPSLPAAPVLQTPNREIDPSNLNIATAMARETASLIHPPTVASPVSHPGQEPAKEIPQIGLEASNQPSAANLISIPATPLRSAGIAAIPPANQIAPSDIAKAGSSGDNGTANMQRGSGASSHGSSTVDAANSRNQDHGGTTSTAASQATVGAPKLRNPTSPPPLDAAASARTIVKSSTAEQASATSAAARNSSVSKAAVGGAAARASNPVVRPTTEIASSGSSRAAESGKVPGGAAGSTPADDLQDVNLPGVTRITMPKDGKFGVVVQGSAASSRYPEAAGALSGRVVSTVFLRVGLRKNWILQYCLPKAGDSGSSTTPIDPPWPFVMLRQDRQVPSDPDYIMVHGMLSTAGHLDQSAMVFPEEVEKKDLLLRSLKLWSFRPASQDGEPKAVEVLLIIPRETE